MIPIPKPRGIEGVALSPYSLDGVIPAIRIDLSPFPLMVAHSAPSV
jgi:hypothetical protein